MSCCKLRIPWPIHFKLCIVIGIDSLTVCILFGEISIFHSRVMRLYSSNCRRFFVCRTVNWEPLGQFTSSFAQLLEMIVLWSVYFLVKFRFFIQELWERKSLQILYECRRRAYHALLAQLFIINVSSGNRPSSDFAAMLLEVFFIPKTYLQNWWWTFSMLNLSINDKISQLVPWILALFLALKTRRNILP
jgi:hypothetical protein